MINSKHLIPRLSPAFSRDAIHTLIRNFSKTCILERRVNFRKPRPPFYEKALIQAICKPKYAPDIRLSLPDSQKCMKGPYIQFFLEKKGLHEENVFENILAKEIRDLFEKSKLVAILHQSPMLAEVLFDVKQGFRRLGMEVRDYHGRHTIQMALEDSKYISIMPLFKMKEMMIFSPENNVEAFLKVLKKTPQVILMATIIDGELLSKTQTEAYAATNLQTQRALLVQTINSAATTLASQLNHHPQTLVSALDQHSSSSAETVPETPDSTESSS